MCRHRKAKNLVRAEGGSCLFVKKMQNAHILLSQCWDLPRKKCQIYVGGTADSKTDKCLPPCDLLPDDISELLFRPVQYKVQEAKAVMMPPPLMVPLALPS